MNKEQNSCRCAECGKKDADGWALYCVDCMEKINVLMTAQPVQPADLHNRLADLHLYEEIAEHYAKCAISPEALRDWVAERVNTLTLPEQPERQWVGLTDEEMSEIIDREIGFNSCWGPEETFARAIEAKLKEKNT